jgi:rhodanese-related sulfurtransferase
MNVLEFSDKITQVDVIVLDVRTPEEFSEGHIKGARNIDFNDENFKLQIDVLEKSESYAIYCRSGNRSGKAMSIMNEAGFGRISHLDGGIIAWADAGMPSTSP